LRVEINDDNHEIYGLFCAAEEADIACALSPTRRVAQGLRFFLQAGAAATHVCIVPGVSMVMPSLLRLKKAGLMRSYGGIIMSRFTRGF
jgi:hypothetical protein